MSGDTPLLSICVPTFNRAWLLERNVTFHLEVFRSRGIAFEIVIVDDCSTDATSDYLTRVAGTPELSVFRRHRNSGFLENYAFAMRRARGRYAIFVGDDDQLVPDQVLAYLARMQADPSIGLIQAPWMEVDERPGRGDMGPFYKIPNEARFTKGHFAAFAQFLFDFHVFPEFMIIRREILVRSISAKCPFIFWAFLFTGRALAHADIVFLPTPFARVTVVSTDPRIRQGNMETMYRWDDYRGGLEFIVALSMRDSTAALESRTGTTDAINRFMMLRQKVAVRLLVGQGLWVEAYSLIQRITAYEPLPMTPKQLAEVSQMAGFITAARDAANFSDRPAVLDPLIGQHLMNVLPADVRDRFTPHSDLETHPHPRAFLRLDPAFPRHLSPGDVVFDTNEYIAQFV